MNKALNEAIERLTDGKNGQFVIVVKPTTTERTEKVLVNSKPIHNNAYLLHMSKTPYPIQPNIVNFIDYTDSENFFGCFSVAKGRILNYESENIHVIFDSSIESNDLSSEVIQNQIDIWNRRLDFFNDLEVNDYFGGELVVLC